jgi:hypothetical protein
MTDGDGMQARAWRAGLLFLAVEVCYVASLVASTSGPDVIHRPAVALQVLASAATIAVAWALYELLKPVNQGLATMALLFRVAEAALFGVYAVFSLLLLGTVASGPAGPDAALLTLARQAQSALGQVGQIYFSGGSAIFFYLLQKGRVIPSALAVFCLIATLAGLASALAEIGTPDVARYLALSGPLQLLAALTTGVALLVAGSRRQTLG